MTPRRVSQTGAGWWSWPHGRRDAYSTAGSEALCFLDAYSGYRHIKMAPEDQEKTSFITPYGTFCYVSMHFGLKNAGATHQQCIQN